MTQDSNGNVKSGHNITKNRLIIYQRLSAQSAGDLIPGEKLQECSYFAILYASNDETKVGFAFNRNHWDIHGRMPDRSVMEFH